MSTLFKYVGLPLLAGAYCVYYVTTKRNAKKLEKNSEGITDLSTARVKYTWTIKNVSFLKVKHETRSDLFSDGYNLWQLQLKIKNFDCCISSIFLVLVKSNLAETYAQFHCTASEFGSIAVRTHNFGDVCKFKTLTPQYSYDLILDFYSRSTLENDTLVISCEVHSSINDRNARPLENLSKNDFFNNMERLFSEEKFSDIIFVIGQEEFPAHKFILGSVSEVFEAMFESEMREQIEGRVEIEDIDSATFKEMLRFIYTGKANFEHHAQGLLIVADKYGMKTLKSDAERYLIGDLSVENAAVALAIADRHSAPRLKNEASMFIEANRMEVVKTLGWQNLKTTCPQLLAEVYSQQSNVTYRIQ